MSKIFLLFCTTLALFLSISGFTTSKSSSDLAYHLIFLPVTLYLVYTSFKTLPRSRRIPEVSLSTKSMSLGITSFFFAILLSRGILTISQKGPETMTPIPTAQPLIIRSPTIFPTLPPSLTITHPTQGEVNVRQEPSTASPIIKKVPSGSVYPYLTISGKWYEIQLTTEQIGWVFVDYIVIPTPSP